MIYTILIAVASIAGVMFISGASALLVAKCFFIDKSLLEVDCNG